MAVTVLIPTPFRRLVGGHDSVEAMGRNIRELLDDLEHKYPGVRVRLCDDQGDLKSYVNLFLNDEDIRYLEGLVTSTSDGDVVSIVPAIAGGA